MATKTCPASVHEVRHRRAPLRWEEGLPLGNGRVGVMLWGGGAGVPVRLTLDHADLWDLRANEGYLDDPDFSYVGLRRLVAAGDWARVDEVFEQRQLRENPLGPTKVSLGRLEVELGDGDGYECVLRLDEAMVQGTVAGARMECFAHHDRNVVCLRLEPGALGVRLRPLIELTTALAGLGHPAPMEEDSGTVRVVSQQIPEGPGWAVAWGAEEEVLLVAVEAGASREEARERALATLGAARATGYAALRTEHVASWEAFWAGSAVYVPEARIEFLWYWGLYLLASCSRPGSAPPGLQGVWPMDGVLPPWRGDYHADMNVQETFWPAYASGHLELADSWVELMRESLPEAQAYTRRFFGTEGSFWICCTLPGYTPVPCWHTVQFAWSHSGWLAWLVWLRWRHSMDTGWLRGTGYPVVSEVLRFFAANLERGEDGRLHVPLSSSPEYRENSPEAWCQDPSIDLALIRRCCDWVCEMEAALGMDELADEARRVRAELVDYPLTEGGALCLWEGKPLDASHRHPSHLMAIHPAMDLTVDGGARGIIDASLEQYFALGQHQWAGHTYAQMASLGAVIGRGELAYDCLHKLTEYWLGPNGLHFNRDTRRTGNTAYQGDDLAFTLEANCGAAAGISDMLVQGWGDVVRVFPALPGHWREAAFDDLLTEGAFRVSGALREGRVRWVRVRATVARELRLRDPFAGAAFEANGAEVRRADDLLVVDLAAGQELEVWLSGEEAPEVLQAGARARRSDWSRLGLR